MKIPMGKENRILLAGLAISLALPLAVGTLLGWPTWVTAPLFIAVLFGVYRKLMFGTKTAADHVGILLDRIGLYSGNPVRDLTAHRFAKLIDAAGNVKLANEIRNRFDTLQPDEFPKKYRISTSGKDVHND